MKPMYPRNCTLTVILLSAVSLCSCKATKPAEPLPQTTAAKESQSDVDEQLTATVGRINLSTEITSNDGTLRVLYATEPASVPMNEPFSIDVMVVPAADQPDVTFELSVDAAMPEHAHGMNVEPKVTPLGGSRYRVTDMLFHMAGRWELYFDVTRDGITSRAQDEITLQ